MFIIENTKIFTICGLHTFCSPMNKFISLPVDTLLFEMEGEGVCVCLRWKGCLYECVCVCHCVILKIDEIHINFSQHCTGIVLFRS